MCPASGDDATRRLADATARRSYSKLVAYLAVHTRDVAAAEDALSEAFAAALSNWPANGCPDNPEAWLLTVARRKAIDTARRQVRGQEISRELQLLNDLDEGEDMEIPDRRLGLMFACAHPAIDEGTRAPLMLQVVLGFNAATIASAFLIAPGAMGQRLVRAKNKLRQAGIPFQVPDRRQLPERLEAVLDAVYAAYSEGWADATGTDAARRDLADEAIFLGSLVGELLPDEPEAHGLLALMLHAEARRSARRNNQGDYVPLASQDPDQWDRAMIEQAEALLERASTLGRIGRYQLEAAIQSAHVHRVRSGTDNWPEVAQLYGALSELTGSPVVVVNQALAMAHTEGPEAALERLDGTGVADRLSEYQPYWATRADLLARCGNVQEARDAYEVAIGLAADAAVRRFLRARQSALTA
ncbi:MAG: RNA polymerase sigma factor [Xanthomonadales bacterium]|nr:RNA polymerase sigma factor [Xanthomonadales bacterium]